MVPAACVCVFVDLHLVAVTPWLQANPMLVHLEVVA